MARARERFDTIVLDPPAFAKTRASVPDAIRGYREINLRAMRCLAPGGTLLTASCSFHVRLPEFLGMLARGGGRQRPPHPRSAHPRARRGPSRGPDHTGDGISQGRAPRGRVSSPLDPDGVMYEFAPSSLTAVFVGPLFVRSPFPKVRSEPRDRPLACARPSAEQVRMLSATEVRGTQRRRRSPYSDKQHYHEYILQRIEGFKNSIGREELHASGRRGGLRAPDHERRPVRADRSADAGDGGPAHHEAARAPALPALAGAVPQAARGAAHAGSLGPGRRLRARAAPAADRAARRRARDRPGRRAGHLPPRRARRGGHLRGRGRGVRRAGGVAHGGGGAGEPVRWIRRPGRRRVSPASSKRSSRWTSWFWTPTPSLPAGLRFDRR